MRENEEQKEDKVERLTRLGLMWAGKEERRKRTGRKGGENITRRKAIKQRSVKKEGRKKGNSRDKAECLNTLREKNKEKRRKVKY